MSGLFEMFNVTKRGMDVQQNALHTTAHNISNASTEGYSVQRVTIKATEPFSIPSLNSPSGPGQIGTGAEVSSITRSRDMFLDSQIRKENGTLSKYESREQFLSEVESIFMEPSDQGMATSLTKFWDSWNQLSTNPESSTARTLVAQNADTLATNIKHNYQQLSDMEQNAGDLIRSNVFDVSSIIKQITDVNNQIKAVSVDGNNPNDLMDRRDMLLDNLSKKFSFDKHDIAYDGIDITPKDSTSSGTMLKDGTILKGIAYVNSVSYDSTNKNWNVVLNIDGDLNKQEQINLDDEEAKDFFQDKNIINAIKEKISSSNIDEDKIKQIITYVKQGQHTDDEIKTYISNLNGNNSVSDEVVKSVKASAEECSSVHTTYYDYNEYQKNKNVLATPVSFENGSLSGIESISDEINQYKFQLNNIARNLAISVNTIHSNSIDKANGVNFFYTDAEDPAKNAAEVISVNMDIISNPANINAGKDIGGNAGNGERALMIGQLRNTKMNVLDINSREDFVKNILKNPDGTQYTDMGNIKLKNFADENDIKMVSSTTGSTIDDYFKNSITFLGVSNQEAKNMVSNQNSLLSQMNIRKESVSGVSIDEEVTNMMQFQKAYQANAKMISVIDSLLDVVVNGLVK